MFWRVTSAFGIADPIGLCLVNFGSCFLFPTESIRFRNSKSLPKTSLCVHIGLNSTHIYNVTGFSLSHLHMGGQVQGDKALMGGLTRGGG